MKNATWRTKLLAVVLKLSLIIALMNNAFAYLAGSSAQELEERALPVSQSIKTPKEISTVLSLVEQAILVGMKADKKTVVGVTMPLESVLSDTLITTGKNLKIYPESIYYAIKGNLKNGEKNKKKIAERLVTMQRSGKFTSKKKAPSIKLKLSDGEIVAVMEN